MTSLHLLQKSPNKMALTFASSLFDLLPPLTGGGFWAAFAQVALVYYGFAAAIHCVIPRLFEVESVQVGKRRKGQVAREALLSTGEFFLSFFFLSRGGSTSRSLRVFLSRTLEPLPSISHFFFSTYVKEQMRSRAFADFQFPD